MKTFREIINESLKSIRQKYGDILSYVIGSNIDNTPTRKYTEWLCRLYEKEIQYFDESQRMRLSLFLDYFGKLQKSPNLKKKDINSYKSTQELIDVVAYAMKKSQESKLDIHKIKPEEYLLLNDNNKYSAYYVKTFNACRAIGGGTTWCIVADKEHWKRLDNNYFVILYDKKTKEKYAIAIEGSVISYDKGYSNKDWARKIGLIEVWTEEDELMSSGESYNFVQKYGINLQQWCDKIIDSMSQ